MEQLKDNIVGIVDHYLRFHDLMTGEEAADKILSLISKTESGTQVPCSGVLSRMPHTKDGKIILWGDKVYFPDPDKMIMDRELDIIEGVVEAITIGVQFKEYEGTHTVMFGEHESGNLELYSSRELVPLEPGFEEE